MPHSLAERLADLADRAARPQRLAHRRRAGSPSPRAASRTSASAAAASSAFRSARTRAVRSSWRCSAGGVDPLQLDPLLASSAYLLTPTITRSPDSTSCWYANAASSISPCTQPRSTAATAPPELVDPLDQLPARAPRARPSAPRCSTSRRADRPCRCAPASAARICCVRSAIRAERSVGSASASSKPFVCSDCAPPHDRRQRLDRHADDVVLRLLRGQRRAAGLRVEAQRERLRVRGAEALVHDPRPQPPRRPELRHLLEEVVVRVEEEGQPRPELVRREPRLDRGVGSRRCRWRA